MLPLQLSALLLLAIPSSVHAVFRDEVGHLDYHHELLGLPQREKTLFHRPSEKSKASLLYTLSDVGVLGAVNPTSGAVVWRQFLNGSITDGGGFLRAGDGEGWVASAMGGSVHAWDATSGRNRFLLDFAGEVKDMEIMELTEDGRKDILALSDDGGATVLRRLNGNDGSQVWEFKEVTKDIPLQVSTNSQKVFVISLHGASASYNLKVTVLDTLTGKRLDELAIGTKGDVHSPDDVIMVGANSAAPVLAWVDNARSKLRINVLGTKSRQEFPLAENTLSVEIHAPSLVQSLPHFLVHSKTTTGNRAEVFHVDLKRNSVEKAYDLPHLSGSGAFSASSSDANVYFTRITEEELILLSSASHGVLARWPLSPATGSSLAVHAVSEVIKKAGSEDSYAVRSAVVTDADDWVLVRNGDLAWSRPEGLTGAVAATFAEIPESEEFAKTLDQEAHSNPLEAYIHRVKRHISELQHLPTYLQKVPSRLISSVLGTDVAESNGKLSRDTFGFNKLVILATRRGRLYGLDTGNHGKVLWNKRAFHIPAGEKWDVKGIHVQDGKGQVTVRGATGEYIVIKTDTGKIIEALPPGSWPPVESTALVDSPSGQWLLPIGAEGKIGDIPALWTPKQTVVVRGAEGELQGKIFTVNEGQSSEATAWIFAPPKGQHIVSTASRPSHDVTASIGRVLGDRRVKYKYLNPNTLVVATVDDEASTLTTHLLDTVSGQILASQTYEGVDTQKPIDTVAAENWFLVTYFGQYKLRENPEQSLKGYQLVISDLYESDLPNDRGPLGDSANFSSIDPIDSPTGVPFPSVVSQTYVISAPITALQVSQTRQGISSRQVLAYLPDTQGIIGLPRHLLEPRRPFGRDATAQEAEEGLIRYVPGIEIDPKAVITHERTVVGIEKIIVSPAIVESTSLVFAFGVDVFGTRVAPSQLFDILGKGFNKVTLISTVVALGAGVLALGPVVRGKQINLRWKMAQ
ncbi:DUF1620-domain-containing protein [Thozetella sp. PMI_491]|nr:DUF1620-domain-containing protein [Thozetella sp. PMI_491]